MRRHGFGLRSRWRERRPTIEHFARGWSISSSTRSAPTSSGPDVSGWEHHDLTNPVLALEGAKVSTKGDLSGSDINYQAAHSSFVQPEPLRTLHSSVFDRKFRGEKMAPSIMQEPFFLSLIDNTMPSSHTPVLLFFPVSKPDTDRAIQMFREGFQLLLKSMPLLAGSVKTVPSDSGQKGTVAITGPYWSSEKLFFVRDFRNKSRYDYESLRQRNFPPSALPILEFSRLEFHVIDGPPVLYVEVTLINGGLILSTCPHHSVADGPSCASIIRFFAACCRGEMLDVDQVERVWRRPELLSVTGDKNGSMSEIPEYKYSSSADPMKARNVERSKKSLGSFFQPLLLKLTKILAAVVMPCLSLIYTSRLISFSGKDLARLKDLAANASLPADEHADGVAPFISTLDAMNALIYSAIGRARSAVHGNKRPSLWTRVLDHLAPLGLKTSSRDPSSVQITKFVFPKNIRKVLDPPAPADSIGNIFLCGLITTPVASLTSTIAEVGTLARRIRAANRALDLPYVSRVCRAFRSVPDATRITMDVDLKWDIVSTSWKEQDMCSLDWGTGLPAGMKAERARITDLPFDGACIILPQLDDGGLDVLIALGTSEMKVLKEDPFLREWGTWRD